MIYSTYVDGNSPLHSLPATVKLFSIAVLGTGVFVCGDLSILAGVLFGILLLYMLARISLATMVRQIKFSVPLLVVIFAVQWFVADWQIGLLIILRFAILIMAGSLVTLTTQTSDMVEALEWLLRPLRHLGVNVAKISLCLSLTIRFIPVMARVTQQVREAQRARGLERSIVAVAMPVIVRLLRMSDEIAEAIEARSPEIK